MDIVESLRGKLIVSCQALADEPLHDSYIMGRMAYAVAEGGAQGIRANSVADIREIKKQVDLPIIGIIKQDYPKSGVYITPTMKEIDALAGEGIDIIALDATQLTRPDGSTFTDFFKKVKEKYPEQLFMADCSTVEEGIEAEKAGVDFVGTTLVGYTDHSKGDVPLETLESMLQSVSAPVIAEGNMDTPEKAARALELGSHAVVVGSAITRPQLIAQKFRDAIDK